MDTDTVDVHGHSTNQHRVHFTESTDTFLHDSNIVVTPASDSLINVHLGFLQIGHRYEVKFVFSSGKVSDPLGVRNLDPPNLNLRVVDLRPSEGMHDGPDCAYEVVLELLAHKEKLLREQVVLQSCDNSLQTITLVLHARVLGKGKGTPFLRTGIRCIGVEADEDSEYSDWHGF